jgi:hypothetical protein
MDINAGNDTKFSISDLQTDQLNLTSKGGGSLEVNRAKKISTLSYSLFDSTEVKFKNCQVAVYKPLHVDSGVKMNITINGSAIQKYLAEKH